MGSNGENLFLLYHGERKITNPSRDRQKNSKKGLTKTDRHDIIHNVASEHHNTGMTY
nr:MAG TPA: hypothetical protein [Caudoviricetes sp.]